MKFSIKKLIQSQRNFIFIIASLAIFLMVLAFDLAFTYPGHMPIHLYWLREVLIILAFLMLSNVLYGRRYIEEKNIVYKLKTLFLAIIGLFIAISIPRILFSNDIAFSAQRYFDFFPILQNSIKNLFYTLFFTLFMVVILLLLKDLIYYKSRRGTHRLFRVAVGLLVLYIVYGHISQKVIETQWTFQGKSPVEWVLYAMMLGLLILLSFRTAWVTYLNKRQKFLAFWGGALLLPGAIMIAQSPILEIISRYSFTVGAFDAFVFYFMLIYLVLAEVNLLLHLPTASVFDKKMNEIASLQSLSRLISSVLNYDEVIEKVTSLAKEVLKADYTWLEMVNDNGKIEVVSSQGLSRKEIDSMMLDPEKGVTGWIIRHRSPLLVNEIGKDSRTRYLRRWKKNVGSLLGVPLISQNRVMGILHALKLEEYGFDQDDRDMLQAFANQATVAIENARLVQESIEKERLEQELRVAHDTQLKLLPKQMPEIGSLEIDALCITANEVGGDYYDFIRLENERLGVVIADVSGKGLSAAFYMAELKGIVNAFARLYESPRPLLQKVNETLFWNVDRQTFVSMIYAIVDTRRKRLSFCRAGHGPLIYYCRQRDEIKVLQPMGIGLALDAGPIFNRMIEEQEIKWGEGDFFVFYTDGLTEARNINQEEYGEERLLDLIYKMRERPAHEIRKAIMQDVIYFVGEAKTHDDFSLIVIKVRDS